jgi:flagellar motor switch protein FliM
VTNISLKNYLLSLNQSTFTTTINIKLINATGILAVDPVAIYSAVNKMLGGKGDIPTFASQLQPLEMAFTRKFLSYLLEDLGSAWSSICYLYFAFDELLPQPSDIQMVSVQNIFLLSTFKLSIGQSHGLMTIALPTASFMPLIAHLTPEQEQTLHLIPQQVNLNEVYLDNIPIEVKAILGQLDLSPSEMREMQPGDIILLDQEIDSPITLQIAGDNKFKAFPGLKEKFKGIILQKPIFTKRV